MRNTIERKPVTVLTLEGYIVDVATNKVIGYKCLACSTASVYRELADNLDLMADAISHDIELHRGCL